MPYVSNDDRISAALIRLEQAERLVLEARKIFSYADKQWYEPKDGLYPGQLGSTAINNNEEIEECET